MNFKMKMINLSELQTIQKILEQPLAIVMEVIKCISGHIFQTVMNMQMSRHIVTIIQGSQHIIFHKTPAEPLTFDTLESSL